MNPTIIRMRTDPSTDADESFGKPSSVNATPGLAVSMAALLR
jgi:hypothetical protein